MVLCKYSENSLNMQKGGVYMKDQPLIWRYPRLTKFADTFFRKKGMSKTAVAVLAIVWSLFFFLSNYNLLGKLVATIVVYGFLLFLVLIPLFSALCLFQADKCLD